MNEEKDFFKTCFNTVAGLEVTNESQAIAKEVVLSEVENLQKENKKLNGAIQTYDILLKANVEENKQLKDNWNKLKEWVNKQYDYYMNEEDYIGGRLCFGDMKNNMQEIEQKGNSNVKD